MLEKQQEASVSYHNRGSLCSLIHHSVIPFSIFPVTGRPCSGCLLRIRCCKQCEILVPRRIFLAMLGIEV